MEKEREVVIDNPVVSEFLRAHTARVDLRDSNREAIDKSGSGTIFKSLAFTNLRP